MIKVVPAPEPSGFDARVRQPGLSAIDELIGRPPRITRPGPRRKRIARQRRRIPSDAFPPYWREIIPELRHAYHGRCAYLATFIEPGTGLSTVDHFVPRSKDWRLVYEWSNFRLCAAVINGTKQDRALLDPFEVEEGWFALEFVSFQVVVGPKAPPQRLAEIKASIRDSGLNARECCELRQQYVTDYEQGQIQLPYLERRAPFVAAEMRRAGRLPAK